MDAMLAELRGKGEHWGAACKQAKAEWQAKGVENPDDRTEGYADRINALYREKIGDPTWDRAAEGGLQILGKE
jgi:hypothetical protein